VSGGQLYQISFDNFRACATFGAGMLSLANSKRGTSSISMATNTIIKTTIKTTGASGEGKNS